MAIFINKVEISDEEIGREMQYHPAETREGAWHSAAQSLVIRQLLLQQAANNGLSADDALNSSSQQEEAVIDQLLEQDVKVPQADTATCRRFYDTHQESFIDKESGQRRAFDEVHEQIRGYIHTKAMRVAVAEYIKALSFEAEIKGFDL
ncbi:MAG: hypothetical protein KJO80_03160 [Gammaproteobacteria bacterium]|nr:hypothetical protein [Gammaproteobacteria bacterium]NNL00122.1 hypothetical protein [Xanthomonadales bacterium]